MSFSLGIVGLPNVGKSTLFNALSKAGAAVSNYPFCTIEPNVGRVPVPDERLLKIQQLLHSPKIVQTTVEFIDIAGLVKGAHKGEGLGNQFLSHIREVAALVQVVRCFPDPNIVHVSGEVDPVQDMETINLELILADIAQVDKKLSPLKAAAKTNDPKILKQLKAMEDLRKHLDEVQPARTFKLEPALIKDLPLITNKPVLYVANVDESGDPDQAKAVEGKAQAEGALSLALCAKLEADLMEMTEEEALELSGTTERGLLRLIKTGYQLLDLITFYTSNEKETRAWTAKAGTLAPQAAGQVHSDMERGFIAAEVVHYNDLVAAGGLPVARDKGWLHTEGREYRLKDGDLVLFRFNV